MVMKSGWGCLADNTTNKQQTEKNHRVLSGREMERWLGDPCLDLEPKPVRLFIPANSLLLIELESLGGKTAAPRSRGPPTRLRSKFISIL